MKPTSSNSINSRSTQPAQQPEAQDLKAIEDYIYSSINHTEEWKKAEQAYQNILNTRSRPAPSQKTCNWKEDDNGNWHTSCNQIHQFTNGTPEENRHTFCPYCGKKLRTPKEQP